MGGSFVSSANFDIHTMRNIMKAAAVTEKKLKWMEGKKRST